MIPLTSVIALARENRPNDGLSGQPAQITDGAGQVYVHGGERLLHVLDGAARFLHMPVPQPPDRAYGTIDVPDVTLAPRQVLGPPRVHQIDPQPFLLQYFLYRPMNSG